MASRTRSCRQNVERALGAQATLVGDDLDPKIGSNSKIEWVVETRSLELTLDKNLKVGTNFKPEEEVVIGITLKGTANLFAWSVTDLPRMDPYIVVHRLSIFKEASYVS